MPTASALRYDIRRAPDGWTWRALDDNGVTAARGRASTRALAAACVVHAIASTVATTRPER
jgi:hypothetical protein